MATLRGNAQDSSNVLSYPRNISSDVDSTAAAVKGSSDASYTVEDSVTIFLGLAGHIAEKRGLQDRKGNILCKSSVWPLSYSVNVSLKCAVS